MDTRTLKKRETRGYVGYGKPENSQADRWSSGYSREIKTEANTRMVGKSNKRDKQYKGWIKRGIGHTDYDEVMVFMLPD
jgi:hypothetical protein